LAVPLIQGAYKCGCGHLNGNRYFVCPSLPILFLAARVAILPQLALHLSFPSHSLESLFINPIARAEQKIKKKKHRSIVGNFNG